MLGRFCLLGSNGVSGSEWCLGNKISTDYSDMVARDHFISGVRIVAGEKTVSLPNVQLASEQLPACLCFGILTFICVTSQ